LSVVAVKSVCLNVAAVLNVIHIILVFLAYFCVVFLSKFMTVRILYDSQKQFQLLPFFVNNYQKLLFCVLFLFSTSYAHMLK